MILKASSLTRLFRSVRCKIDARHTRNVNCTLSITHCNAHTFYECSFIGASNRFFFIDLLRLLLLLPLLGFDCKISFMFTVRLPLLWTFIFIPFRINLCTSFIIYFISCEIVERTLISLYLCVTMVGKNRSLSMINDVNKKMLSASRIYCVQI